MKFDFKTIIGFVVIGVVAYLCRPLDDKIADVFIEDKNDIVDMEVSNEEEIGVFNVSGNIEGHDYVDLGLSVKWATCNIGATKPEEYGDYFAWGETEPKESYESETYLWTSNDAAQSKWGGPWRMPTREECKELVRKCIWRWTAIKGVNGYKITASNGNWIFLPAAGIHNGTSSYNVPGSYGYYWSSTVRESNSNYACYLFFHSSSKYTNSSDRSYGYTVRPVTE